METKEQIAEINSSIREGINQWADIMLTSEADEWAYQLNYFPRDLMNALLIFQHVASNIGIKAGKIDERKALEFGKRFCYRKELKALTNKRKQARTLANDCFHNLQTSNTLTLMDCLSQSMQDVKICKIWKIRK